MTSRARLPEEMTYVDTGCEVAPKCLACPLARCRYDVGLRVVSRRERRETVLALRERGLTAEEIAASLSVSRRTVFRALEGRAA